MGADEQAILTRALTWRLSCSGMFLALAITVQLGHPYLNAVAQRVMVIITEDIKC